MPGLLRPLEIGGVRLPNNLVLSPMAGFSDLPFRILCRREGAGLVCSEMVSAGSVERRVARTLVRMETADEERPTSIQLFGTDPEEVARAAREAEKSCEILGFNMGCPAHQIKRQGCGAALLDKPDLAEAIVRAIKGASRRPLLVKMRAGNGGRMDAVAFAHRLERAGADALIFHARTAAQGYSGRSDWDLIRDVKAALSIPVIGNGDVTDSASAEAALLRSGADGVALGRGALGDPHVFRRISTFLSTGDSIPMPSPRERFETFLEYLRLSAATGLGFEHALTQAHQFTRGIPGSARLRERIAGKEMPVEEIRALFEAHLAEADRRLAARAGAQASA